MRGWKCKASFFTAECRLFSCVFPEVFDLIQFVDELRTDQGFEHVLQGDCALGASKFVNDESEVLP